MGYELHIREGGPLYWLYEGEVIVKGCRDSQQIEDARSVAAALDARLEGDDGEFYDGPADAGEAVRSEVKPKRRWWQRG